MVPGPYELSCQCAFASLPLAGDHRSGVHSRFLHRHHQPRQRLQPRRQRHPSDGAGGRQLLPDACRVGHPVLCGIAGGPRVDGPATQVDHIVPKAAGWTDARENLQGPEASCPRHRTPLRKGRACSRQAWCHGKPAGFASSILHMGPPWYSGPSNLTKAGASPPRTQTWLSGGCFPVTRASKPAIPPICTFTS